MGTLKASRAKIQIEMEICLAIEAEKMGTEEKIEVGMEVGRAATGGVGVERANIVDAGIRIRIEKNRGRDPKTGKRLATRSENAAKKRQRRKTKRKRERPRLVRTTTTQQRLRR